MSPRAAITAIGALAVTAELCLGTLGFATIGPDRIVLFLLTSAAATGAMTLAMRRLLRPLPEDGGAGEGGMRSDPDDDPPSPWWPAFEAEFRRYARDSRQTPV